MKKIKNAAKVTWQHIQNNHDAYFAGLFGVLFVLQVYEGWWGKALTSFLVVTLLLTIWGLKRERRMLRKCVCALAEVAIDLVHIVEKKTAKKTKKAAKNAKGKK